MRICTFVLSILAMTFFTTVVFAESTPVLDKIISNNSLHPADYMKGEVYKETREVIREELIIKMNQMIKNDDFAGIIDCLFFVVDISDPRYVGLIKKVEKQIGSYAGVNLRGYSRFIELKIKQATNDKIIAELVRPQIGSQLYSDIAWHIMQRSESITRKLQYFKKVVNKSKFKYLYVNNSILRSLCSENSVMTNEYIKNNELKKKLLYDCSNINEAP